MGLSDTFRKLFNLKTQELQAERDHWREQAEALGIKVHSLESTRTVLQNEVQAQSRQLQELAKENGAIKEQLVSSQDEIQRLKGLARQEPPAVNLVERNGPWVQDQLKALMGKSRSDGTPLFNFEPRPFWLEHEYKLHRVTLDGKYQLPSTLADLETMLRWGYDEDRAYATEWYDCENYAIYLKGMVDRSFLSNCVGLVVDFGTAHAYNLAMLADGSLYVIEPQGLQVWKLEERPLASLYGLSWGVFLL